MYNKDTISVIISFFDIKEVLNLKLVCKKYYNIINGEEVWNLLLRRDYPQFLKITKDSKQMYKQLIIHEKDVLLNKRIEDDIFNWSNKPDDYRLFEDYTLIMAKIVFKKIYRKTHVYPWVSFLYFDIFEATYDKDVLIYGINNFKMDDIFDAMTKSLKDIMHYDNDIKFLATFNSKIEKI